MDEEREDKLLAAIDAKLRDTFSYDPETGVFCRISGRTNRKLGVVGPNKGTGYVYLYCAGKNWLGHRVAWLFEHGRWPDGILDHVNRVRHDNRIANLRQIDYSGNAYNAKVHCRSQTNVAGICWHKGESKWRAYVARKHLGNFDSLFDAVCARKSWESQNLGL